MKKNFLLWSAASAFIMLFLPWLAVTFVKADGGMVVCFVLFYGVDPIYSIMLGDLQEKGPQAVCGACR